ncbi:hypothetical protein Syun_004956 [Stephania yunnanensis]|uniref:Uncharacterized protein n=1 Tax=Stephania yunnanensis TaxID=152371 RepID=A0AAP0L835_9MAGN
MKGLATDRGIWVFILFCFIFFWVLRNEKGVGSLWPTCELVDDRLDGGAEFT